MLTWKSGTVLFINKTNRLNYLNGLENWESKTRLIEYKFFRKIFLFEKKNV